MTTATRPLGVDTFKAFLYWSQHHNLPWSCEHVTWEKTRLSECGHREEDRHCHDEESKRTNWKKKVRFSQKFPLIIHTPTHSSAQSCYKGHFCGLKIKIVRVTAPSWYVTSPAVPAAGDLLSQHISGTKWLLAALFSYISSPPRPLLCLTSLCSHFFFLVLFVSFQKMILSFSSFLFLVSPRPPLLYLHASSLLETNAQFSVFIYTNFPSADIPDVHCNPSSSSSPSSYPNLLQPPKSTSCNH